jgi:hypothetical protein
MSAWIIKGRPSINDLALMLLPGKKEEWITRKPPRTWAAGDLAFMWKGAPALCVLGLAEIVSIRPPDANGDSWFTLRYTTGPLQHPLGIEQLRADRILGDASFLKSGAAGTVFALSADQATHLMNLVRHANHDGLPHAKSLPTSGGGDSMIGAAEPKLALSVRQPWAKLIVRGEKTIEVRSIRTNIRGRVHVYASLGETHPEHRARVNRQCGLDIDRLPRGVLVGTVEIIGCRPLTVRDSGAAAFPVPENTGDFAWLLGSPEAAARWVKPTRHPQPVFFRPF